MEYAQTIAGAFAESSLVLRPGSVCSVNIVYLVTSEVEWDSSTEYTHTYNGFMDKYSVKSTSNLDYDKILSRSDTLNTTTLIIEPMDIGIIDITIYSYMNVTADVVSRPAFYKDGLTTNTDYYKDYEVIDGMVYPKTIIPYTSVIGDIEDIEISFYSVDFDRLNTGIAILDGLSCSITNDGFLTYNGDGQYVLKSGKERVLIPGDCGIDKQYIIREVLSDYELYIINPRWISGVTEAMGVIVYDEYLLLLTDNGLYVIDLLGNVDEYKFHYPSIKGTDLTYAVDDCIYVANGYNVDKYKMRHDLCMIDNNNKKIYFREKNPHVKVRE